jgi:hypothetical protein
MVLANFTFMHRHISKEGVRPKLEYDTHANRVGAH